MIMIYGLVEMKSAKTLTLWDSVMHWGELCTWRLKRCDSLLKLRLTIKRVIYSIKGVTHSIKGATHSIKGVTHFTKGMTHTIGLDPAQN